MAVGKSWSKLRAELSNINISAAQSGELMGLMLYGSDRDNGSG